MQQTRQRITWSSMACCPSVCEVGVTQVRPLHRASSNDYFVGNFRKLFNFPFQILRLHLFHLFRADGFSRKGSISQGVAWIVYQIMLSFRFEGFFETIQYVLGGSWKGNDLWAWGGWGLKNWIWWHCGIVAFIFLCEILIIRERLPCFDHPFILKLEDLHSSALLQHVISYKMFAFSFGGRNGLISKSSSIMGVKQPVLNLFVVITPPSSFSGFALLPHPILQNVSLPAGLHPKEVCAVLAACGDPSETCGSVCLYDGAVECCSKYLAMSFI